MLKNKLNSCIFKIDCNNGPTCLNSLKYCDNCKHKYCVKHPFRCVKGLNKEKMPKQYKELKRVLNGEVNINKVNLTELQRDLEAFYNLLKKQGDLIKQIKKERPNSILLKSFKEQNVK